MQPIKTTGIRGFLQWFAQDQPDLFKKVAPLLPKAAPQAFSNYNRRVKKLRKVYRETYSSRGNFSGLGDYASYVTTPVTVDYTAQLTQLPAYTSTNVQYQAGNAPTLPTDSTGNVLTAPSAPTITSAANTGSANAGTVSAIGSTISSVASSFMSAAQVAALTSLVTSQLARAQSGGAPANISSRAAGIPVVSTGPSMTTLLLIALAGGAALYFVRSK